MLLKPKSHTSRGHGSKLSQRKQRIYDFLRENPVGVLSTVDPNGNPHGMVIYFDIDEQLAVSFLTRSETYKYDNLKHNNHIMLTVCQLQSQTTAQIIGTAHEIKDHNVISDITNKILAITLKTSRANLPPTAKLQAGPYAAFRIEPVQIRMAVYADADPGSYNELFESVESFDIGEATS